MHSNPNNFPVIMTLSRHNKEECWEVYKEKVNDPSGEYEGVREPTLDKRSGGYLSKEMWRCQVKYLGRKEE